MVHVRLNERETNPNPLINFITVLPLQDATVEEDSRQLLRALAAQVKPVMKSHGFAVNRFEEYRYNQVFAGRNWNNGEVVEIVLRGPTGAYYPNHWLLGTLCHELAHIKHMNHGPAFQALWTQLRKEVRALQNRGYYGDGYWSAGTRLADSATVGGLIEDAGALPEYMCGGAQTRRRRTAGLHRRRRDTGGPSNLTGAQTAKKRKAGSRVTAQGTFKGEGHALNEDLSDDGKKKGSGFRKKAVSNRAREERALAAEKRLQSLFGNADTSSPSRDSDDGSEGEEETDQDRKSAMADTIPSSDLESLRTWRNMFIDDFFLPASQPEAGPSGLRSSEAPASDGDVRARAASSKGKWPLQAAPVDYVVDVDELGASGSMSRPKKRAKVSYGSIVADEVQFRKKEALGLSGEGRQLGRRPAGIDLDRAPDHKGRTSSVDSTSENLDKHFRRDEPEILDLTREEPLDGGDVVWTCGVCTLMNLPQHLACDACGTARGEGPSDKG